MCTLVPNVRSFEQLLGELMVHNKLIGVEGHDRLTSYLNFDTGLVEQGCFFKFIIFMDST